MWKNTFSLQLQTSKLPRAQPSCSGSRSCGKAMVGYAWDAPFYTKCQFQLWLLHSGSGPSFLLWILGDSSSWPSSWTPTTKVGNLHWDHGFWLQPGLSVAAAGIWGVWPNRQKIISISLFIYLSSLRCSFSVTLFSSPILYITFLPSGRLK